MAIQQSGAVTVQSNAPTRLDTQLGLEKRRLSYYNAGAVDVWLGDSAVSIGNGFRLQPGGTTDEIISKDTQRWAIAASSTCQVNVDQVPAP